jgi:hypothetical protein
MRLGWHIHIWGPFYLSGTVAQTKPSGGRAYQRKYQTLDCGHAHRTIEAYNNCVRRNNDRRRG